MEPAKIRKRTKMRMRRFLGKYFVEYAPKGEKTTARMMIGIAAQKRTLHRCCISPC